MIITNRSVTERRRPKLTKDEAVKKDVNLINLSEHTTPNIKE